MLAGAKRPRKDCGRGSGEERPADSDIQGNFFRFFRSFFGKEQHEKLDQRRLTLPRNVALGAPAQQVHQVRLPLLRLRASQPIRRPSHCLPH